MFFEDATGFRGSHTARRAPKQLGAQFIFQAQELLTQRRLRDAKCIRGPRDGAEFDNLEERP
jgi:hypothetical protein